MQGVEGLGESVKKGKFATKIILIEVLKSCKKMISPDVKADANQEIKELVAASYNVS